MSSDSKTNKHVFVNDGDTVIVIAGPLGPTVSDPTHARPYLSQAFRVVADSFSPVLALVPLGAKPTAVSQGEIDQFNERQEREREREKDEAAAKWIGLVNEARAERDAYRALFESAATLERIKQVIAASGWAFPQDILVDSCETSSTIEASQLAECPLCFDEENSLSCVRPSHPAWQNKRAIQNKL